ncbi:4Fe-4S binding protein [bacterium]|nr:4Fe-4S binding protein [bacterium]
MIYIVEEKCDYCGVCVSVCAPNVIELNESSIKILDGCTDCNLCLNVCPYEAIKKNEK